MLFFVSACSSAPEKPAPYWLQTANSFIAKGVVLYSRQKYSESTVEFTRALNAYQRFDYVEGLAESYLNLAKSEIAQNNISNAQNYLQHLESLIKENNFSSMKVYADIMHSSIAIDLNKYYQVIEIANKYLGLTGENETNLADNIYMALLTNRVKVAVFDKNEADKWVNIYDTRVAKNNFYQARLLRFKGQLSRAKNNIDMNFSQALSLYREQANPKAVLSTLKEWGKTLSNNNKFEDSVKRFETAYKVAESSANEFEMRKVLDLLLGVYRSAGDDGNIQRINRLISK